MTAAFSTFFPDFFKINFYWSIVALQCCVSFYCTAKWKMNQLYIYTYIPSLLDLGHHSALSRVPCAVQYVLISYVFLHSIKSVYVSIPISQFLPFPFPPLYPYICSLRLCLYFYFANRIICTIFLDSTYMH